MLELRAALPTDVPAIRSLIWELAEYEKEPQQAIATEEDLLRDGFGPVPRYKCLMALWDGAPVGFALYFNNYSTWQGRWGLYLEDLFVRPAMRGKGIGKALLVELARIAVRDGCGRFQWQVLDWNQPSIEFYERLGARHMNDWLPFRLDGAALERFAASTP
jgi:GNAT superfamily N-acetyltransferase